jgi:hypothetical protein
MAKQARLAIKACTTPTGIMMGQEFLKPYGFILPLWYGLINRKGKAYQELREWYRTQELYLLSCKVETPTGWEERAIIYGGGPLVPEERVYTLDISDIPGDSITLMLAPPINYWMIDYLALDFSPAVQLLLQEVRLAKPVYPHQAKAVESMQYTDGLYHVMEHQGDSLEISFPVPRQQPGTQRTVFLKGCGYYTYHLPARGLPQWSLIKKLWQPDYAAHYTIKFHAAWYNRTLVYKAP